MSEDSTVFILGAGASVPYKYPTGFELNEKIKNFLLNCPEYLETASTSQRNELKVLFDLGYTLEDLRKFYDALFKASTTSIDKFLENRPDLLEIGKIMTVYELKRREHLHKLFIGLKEDNWYSELFNQIDLSIHNIGECNFKFITFNYDRSLEVFLYSMLKERTTESEDAVLSAFKKIPIVHVYGCMGYFPWEKNGIAYDGNLKAEDLKMMSKNIHIMSDERGREEDFNSAHVLISNAKSVYFIGFGYDKANLDRLRIKEALRNQALLGTAFGVNARKRMEVINYFSMNVTRIKNQTTYKTSGHAIELLDEKTGIMSIFEDADFEIV